MLKYTVTAKDNKGTVLFSEKIEGKASANLETYTYPSDELLNCVDIEAEACALIEEMESLPKYEEREHGSSMRRTA